MVAMNASCQPRRPPTVFLGGNSRRGDFILDACMLQVEGHVSREVRWGWDGASLGSVSDILVDPIGYRGGINLYWYVGNRPIGLVDPHGLFGLDPVSAWFADYIWNWGYTPYPSSTITPFQLGMEWLTGLGPRHRDFGPGDSMTEDLRGHSHIQESITFADQKLEEACKGDCDASGFSPISRPYSLAGWGGIAKYLYDYSTVATGGMMGNLTVTYLGSYSATITASKIDCCKGTATLTFVVTNTSTAASATRPPVAGYTEWWNTVVQPAINSFFSEGAMSETSQRFEWTESASFTKCTK